MLIQKIWNKAKQLQQVTDFASYNLIWHNSTYAELAKLQNSAKWITYRVTHLHQIFANRTLLSLTLLFSLPQYMYFPPQCLPSCIPLKWQKDIISRCCAMLVSSFLKGYPFNAPKHWKKDVGPIYWRQLEEALQAVQLSSLNVSQQLS